MSQDWINSITFAPRKERTGEMKRYILLCIGWLSCMCLAAQSVYQRDRDWTQEEPQYRGVYFLTDMAIQTAENVLRYQLPDGGWPRGIYYPAALTEEELSQLSARKSDWHSSLQGRSTLAEIHFLSNMYQSTARRKYRKAAEEGVHFLLRLQSASGGWPQQVGLQPEVLTFGDNLFVQVMALLGRVAEGKAPYDFMSAATRQQCRDAFERGVNFILRTQCEQQGKLTAWCAHYDAATLQPVAGTGQDMLALNSQLSDDIVQLLMSLPSPSVAVCQAVEGAIAWYKDTKISGQTRQNYVNKEGKRDFRFVEDRHAPDMWALYVQLSDNHPLFSEPDGTVCTQFDELSYEGRKSLSWFTNDGGRLLRNYEKWKASLGL